jgi:predicted metal-binding membrane protein
MVILLVSGMMNLALMAIIAAAITIERLAPRPQLFAQAAGIMIIVAGALGIARVLGVI